MLKSWGKGDLQAYGSMQFHKSQHRKHKEITEKHCHNQAAQNH